MELLADYDVIVDGSDNFATRYLVNDACVLLRKPNVYGSVLRFEGQASVFSSGDGPCYRCLFREPPPPALVQNCAESGVLGVVPGLIGVVQAAETIKLITGIGETLVGRLLLVDALRMRFRTIDLARDPECVACGRREITALIDYEVFCGVGPGRLATTQSPDERDDEITPTALAARLARGDAPLLLDVREPYEWAIARLPDARLVPLEQPARCRSTLWIVARRWSSTAITACAAPPRSSGFASRASTGCATSWAESTGGVATSIHRCVATDVSERAHPMLWPSGRPRGGGRRCGATRRGAARRARVRERRPPARRWRRSGRRGIHACRAQGSARCCSCTAVATRRRRCAISAAACTPRASPYARRSSRVTDAVCATLPRRRRMTTSALPARSSMRLLRAIPLGRGDRAVDGRCARRAARRRMPRRARARASRAVPHAAALRRARRADGAGVVTRRAVRRWTRRRSSVHDPGLARRATRTAYFRRVRCARSARRRRRVGERSRRSRVPTLVVNSREDNRIPRALAETATATLRGPTERHWVTGCGHVITVDYCRDAVASLVSDFLARHAD